MRLFSRFVRRKKTENNNTIKEVPNEKLHEKFAMQSLPGNEYRDFTGYGNDEPIL